MEVKTIAYILYYYNIPYTIWNNSRTISNTNNGFIFYSSIWKGVYFGKMYFGKMHIDFTSFYTFLTSYKDKRWK